MPRTKYDLVKLKQDFFSSEYSDVKSFLRSLWIAEKINTMKTKGRNKEKREHREKVLAKAMNKAITKQANELEIPMDQLTLAKKNAVAKVMQQILDKDLDIKDLETSIKILRTEMGLPTSYSKNENTNIEKIEGIHILMGGNPVSNDPKEV